MIFDFNGMRLQASTFLAQVAQQVLRALANLSHLAALLKPDVPVAELFREFAVERSAD